MASLWSGYLAFGLISFPVQLFAGAREKRVSFHMLHRDDLTRVKQQLFCPNDQKVVPRTEIVKGYEYEKGQYVVVEPEEIKKIEPKTAKSMEVLEFVRAAEIDPIYFESSYYLVPDEAGRRPYSLLQKALADSEYVGIAKLSMHNREYTVFLRSYERGIMLHTSTTRTRFERCPLSARSKVLSKRPKLKLPNNSLRRWRQNGSLLNIPINSRRM